MINDVETGIWKSCELIFLRLYQCFTDLVAACESVRERETSASLSLRDTAEMESEEFVITYIMKRMTGPDKANSNRFLL